MPIADNHYQIEPGYVPASIIENNIERADKNVSLIRVICVLYLNPLKWVNGWKILKGWKIFALEVIPENEFKRNWWLKEVTRPSLALPFEVLLNIANW